MIIIDHFNMNLFSYVRIYIHILIYVCCLLYNMYVQVVQINNYFML